MATRYNANSKRLVVKKWWQHTQTLLDLFLQVMENDSYISDQELEDALYYITVRRHEFEKMPHPSMVDSVYTQLLDALKNVQQSLEYRRENNRFYAQSRLNMAQANMDAVRFHLVQFGIIL